MNIYGLLLVIVLVLYGLYEYLCLLQRKFKTLMGEYTKLKTMEKEIKEMFKPKEKIK